MGDILLLPLMLNYNVSPALNYNFRIAVYTPTGDYEKGALANEGKNFWTIGPMAAVMYLALKPGLRRPLSWALILIARTMPRITRVAPRGTWNSPWPSIFHCGAVLPVAASQASGTSKSRGTAAQEPSSATSRPGPRHSARSFPIAASSAVEISSASSSGCMSST